MEASICPPIRRDGLPCRPASAAPFESSSNSRRNTARPQPRRCDRVLSRNLPGMANSLGCRSWPPSHLAGHFSDSVRCPFVQSRSGPEARPLQKPHALAWPAAAAELCAPLLLTTRAAAGHRDGKRLLPDGYCSYSHSCPSYSQSLLLPVSPSSHRHQSTHSASPSSVRRLRSRDTAVRAAAREGSSGAASNSGSDSDSDTEGRFWEGEEGRQKLDEIGELKVIIRERQALEEQLQALEARALQEEEEQGMGPEEAAARAKARADARSLMLRDILEKKAQEQTMLRKEAQSLFLLGQRAYGKGVYDKCVKILEKALGNIERGSSLGGEIQLWLAMAYDANGQRRQCIDLYKRLEEGHPLAPIRKQAYELRYIAEAPKIKMSPDEILTIPILDSDSQSTQRTWSQMVSERRRPKALKASAKRAPDVWDDLEGWEPPKWEQSPYFWVALTLWLTLVGVTLVFQDG